MAGTELVVECSKAISKQIADKSVGTSLNFVV